MKIVPGFMRFSLLTLVLISILIGALMGLWREYPVWHRVANLWFETPGDYVRPRFKELFEFSMAAFDGPAKRIAVYSHYTHTIMMFELSSGRKIWEQKSYMSGRVSVQFTHHDTILEFNNSGGDFPRFFSAADGAVPDTNEFNNLVEEAFRSEQVDHIVDQKDGERGGPSRIFETESGEGIACRSNGADEIAWPNEDSYCTGIVTKGEFRELLSGGGGQTARFSKEGNLLAFVHNERVTVWRRSRDYGWRGFLTIPFLWIAVAAAGGLVFRAVKRIVNRSPRNRLRRLPGSM